MDTSAANAAADYGREVFEPTLRRLSPRHGALVCGGLWCRGRAWSRWVSDLWWLRRAAAARDEQPESVALARTEFLMALSLLLSGLFMVVAVQLGGSTSCRYAIPPSLFLCTFLAASASRLWAATCRSNHRGRPVPSKELLRRVGDSRRIDSRHPRVGARISASEYRRSGPTWSASLAAARSTCRAADAPKTVVVPIAPRKRGSSWHINLDCTSL